jgi:hypothetical protein
MKLQTKVPLQQAKNQIDYQSQLLLLGSCFVENIGDKLDYFKFNTLQNPFGILFHPVAIEKILVKSIKNEAYSEEDIFSCNERWHCFDAHSDLSEPSKENLLNNLKEGLGKTHQQITKSTHIIITLGTAWVYRSIETENIVANCHKVSQKKFTKELLSVETIVESLENIIRLIQSVNSSAQFIFTVSPVRHLKDGFVENQQSKAHLITAVHKIIQDANFNSCISYFESYEIMMDELRDYRFYKRDMVHPNELAVDCIWENFKNVWVSKAAFPIMEKVKEIQQGLQHRPFNPESGEHQKFLKSLNNKIQALQVDFPQMKF